MLNFTYYTPTKVIFGKDTEKQIGALVQACHSHKVLLHYGGKSARKSGVLEKVESALREAHIPYVSQGGVVPNPRLSKVYEGIELCRKEAVDLILAVGGGSVIDSAKAIGYGVANEGDVWDYYEGTRSASACLPIGVVLTIAAAGSEMSKSCVITNEKGWKKRGYSNDLSRPRFAIMNPEFTMSLPEYQTQSGCTDIMMHTMERYFAHDAGLELTDGIAETLLKDTMKNARILLENPRNYEARAEIMWAGSLSHNGLTGCGSDGGDWATHKLEHELGGMFDVTHGAGLAAIWGSWARFVYRDGLERFAKYAVRVMGVSPGTAEETALKGIEATEAFFRSIHMPTSLGELGISPTDEEMKTLAEKCYAACHGPQGTIRKLSQQDMYEIYRMANH